MNTDDLVALLAKDAGPVEQNAAAHRLAAALGWGLLATTVAMALTMGLRADVSSAMALPMFWMKLAVPAVVVIAAWHALTRLGCPGRRIGPAPGITLAALLAAVWLLAIAALSEASPAERTRLVLGQSWPFCLGSISVLSVPVFVFAVRALKGLAPTRLSLAGGAAGLFAGGVSAAVYSLHCTEMQAPFFAVWYVLGMAIPALAGAAIGPRLLRW